jgi:hypothetical protein
MVPPTINLPATYADGVEVEALAFARKWIASCREGNFIDLGVAPLHPEAGRAFTRRLVKQYALMHPFNMDEIVKCAEAGWDDADIALRELVAEYVDRGEAMPAVLAAYNVRLINPNYVQPTKPHGKKKADNILKDMVVVTLVMELITRFPLEPTRFQLGRKRKHSACSIAADVTTEAGLHRGGEAAIQKIWSRYQKAVLPGRAAEAALLTTKNDLGNQL